MHEEDGNALSDGRVYALTSFTCVVSSVYGRVIALLFGIRHNRCHGFPVLYLTLNVLCALTRPLGLHLQPLRLAIAL